MKKLMKNKLFLIIAGVVVIVGLIFSFAEYNHIQKIHAAEKAKQAQEAEQKAMEAHQQKLEDYEGKIKTAASDIIQSAALAEEMINVINQNWHDAIFVDNYNYNGVYTSDFNEAILLVLDDFASQGKVQELNDARDSIKFEIQSLSNPPDEEKDLYEKVMKFYEQYNRFSSLALSPEGTLQTYGEETRKLDSDLLATYEDLTLRIPDMKQ